MLTSYIVPAGDGHVSGEPRWLLAIDTSADRAGLALFDGNQLHERAWPATRQQTTQVPVGIAALLASAELTTADLGGVAVAIGPGTFTGLRVGMSLAKGLALAERLPIAGVQTLRATAWPWCRAHRSVIAVLPAGRGRIVWQRFGEAGAAVTQPLNGTPADLLALLDRERVDLVTGELPADLRDVLAGATVPVLAEPGLASRIGAVTRLGWDAIQAGEIDDLAALEPLYVHGAPKIARPVRDPRQG